MIDRTRVEQLQNIAAPYALGGTLSGKRQAVRVPADDVYWLAEAYGRLRSIVEDVAQHPPVYWPRLGMIACADCGAELRSINDTTAHFLGCSHRRAVELLGMEPGE